MAQRHRPPSQHSAMLLVASAVPHQELWFFSRLLRPECLSPLERRPEQLVTVWARVRERGDVIKSSRTLQEDNALFDETWLAGLPESCFSGLLPTTLWQFCSHYAGGGAWLCPTAGNGNPSALVLQLNLPHFCVSGSFHPVEREARQPRRESGAVPSTAVSSRERLASALVTLRVRRRYVLLS